MNIIIYEDEGYRNFLPLTWLRPVYELKSGINTLAEKIVRQYPGVPVDFSCRYYLPGNKLMKLEKGLFINGRVLADSRLAKQVPLKGPDEIFLAGEEIVAIRAVSKNFEAVSKKAKIKKVDTRMIQYPWDLVNENGGQIGLDKKHLPAKRKYKIHKSVVVYNHRDVVIDEGAEIEANVVIDARSGPVYIGKDTIVRPQTYLKGPVSLGPMCRVGGEISATIFHGFSNKQHYGFIGNSYLGEWVNLGAGTTNSNLKNNYGNVKVVIEGKSVDTGCKYVGCFVGDHAKCGIGTLITTGGVIGVGANVFGGGVTPKVVPSFSWGLKEKYKWDEAIAACRIVMSRRQVKMPAAVSDLLKKVYKLAQ